MPRKLVYLLFFLSLTAYLTIGHHLKRENVGLLISLYSGLFAIYFLLLHYKQHFGLYMGIFAGLIFRLALLFSLPALSDDFYRFLWDGRLQQLGINPFDYLPSQVIAQNADSYLVQLFPNLNSPGYYSVYPQLLQYIFLLAVELGGQNLLSGVLVLKSVILLFECGSIYLLIKLLKSKHLNPSLALIYVLNPLIIIELTGNIHFEAIMIFFILLGAYLLEKKQLAALSASIALAIQAKLLPLLAIPLMINRIGLRKTIWVGLACVVILIISSPLLWGSPDRLLHFFSSLRLYFGNFEFNGSVYSLLRGLGFWLSGFNMIEWTSKFLMIVSLLVFIKIYQARQFFLRGFFWLMFSYLLLSAVVHPWYLAILIALTPFVSYRFALIWSAVIPLTYITYASVPYQQNYWLIALEYTIVAGYLIYETGYFANRTQTEAIKTV